MLSWGYSPKTQGNVNRVSSYKRAEEIILRELDDMLDNDSFDQRWLAIGRTHIQQGFMAITRAVFRPTRIALPDDAGDA